VFILDPSDGRLATFVFRRTIFGCRTGNVEGAASVIGAIGMKERRDGEHNARIKGVNPGKGGKFVVLPVVVLLSSSRYDVRVVGVEGHWIIVAPDLDDETKLILWTSVEDQRCESAKAVGRIMNYGGGGRL